MENRYNVRGIVDRPNTAIINKILKLKEKGNTFEEISKIVSRSPKRVKELYYREIKKNNESIKV